MATDRYTKTVLTVIAAALVALAAQHAVQPSNAATDTVQKVAICDVSGTTCMTPNFVFGRVRLYTYPP